MTRAFERQYDEEAYLFDVVGPQFRQTGDLDAYAFFFIVRWKANRAISKIARRLIQVSGADLEKAAADLGRDVYRAKDACERFRILSTKWRMRLPMASAILTVLYPDEFTVYDSRVCKELADMERPRVKSQERRRCRSLQCVRWLSLPWRPESTDGTGRFDDESI